VGSNQRLYIGIYFFSSKHTALMRKSKDWFARYQDYVSEWSNISTRISVRKIYKKKYPHIIIISLNNSGWIKLTKYITYTLLIQYSEWMRERLLFNANMSSNFQLYHGENKWNDNDVWIFFLIDFSHWNAGRNVAPLGHIILIPS
jgi:CRISPR/Cas system CSM-associated protein Csm4 (group 5 of RAMP superfamily)